MASNKKKKPTAPPPPPAATDTNLPQPIGVPSNYLAARPQDPYNTFTNSGAVWDPGSGDVYYPSVTPPRYYDGDEFLPATMSRDQIIGLQSQLEALGLDNYVPGVWDSASQKAFRELLTIANGSGKSWQEALGDVSASGGVGGTQRARQPLTVQLTSEDDIRAVIQSGAQKVFGKYLDEADIQKFIGAYHAQETQAQQQAYGMAESGGTYTAPPSSSGGINELFRRQFVQDHTNEAGAAIFSSELDNILGALRGRQL